MALDGAYLHAVRQELLPLLDSRIEKIHQPTREELLVAFRGRTGGAKVLFSCAADRARVHLTQVAVENPKAPPMFCMLLRKRLGNGKLLAIRQDGLERVLYFDFSCVNELGDIVQLTLAIEIMGRYSNLILIDETGKVIVLKRISDDPYMCITECADVHKIANIEKKVPLEWITDDDYVTEDMIKYIHPLIQQELPAIMVDGLPRHLNINR